MAAAGLDATGAGGNGGVTMFSDTLVVPFKAYDAFTGMEVRVKEVLLATGNPHKLVEVREILASVGWSVVGLDDLDGPIPPEPVEDATTFEGNARIKAISYAEATGRLALADDSGLEVDALGGEPGVLSARFAGVEGERAVRDAANNRLLMKRIKDVPTESRHARFVCAMCLAAPDGTVVAESRGTFDGMITDQPRGQNGFGYDPHLWLPQEGRTSAELTSDEKNARSHRGEAARAIAACIGGLTSAP